MTEFRVYEDPAALGADLGARRAAGQSIGLVPTMGNLHAGHLALIAAAREHCDFVLATIFINPLQFAPAEDLARYPRTFDADVAALQQAGCAALFAPAAHAMYPQGLQMHTRITVPDVSSLHCGRTRPGHFDGVCTVVCKLFNLTRPDHAFFGLKDYQQFHIIGRMTRDLHLAVTLHGIATVRESSGLALSSRNNYLNATERGQAPALYATLQASAQAIAQGERNYAVLEAGAGTALLAAGLKPDYVHVCNSETLLPAAPDDRHLVILAAAWAGTTRLIDNIAVHPVA